MWVTAYTDASFADGVATWAVWLRCSRGRVVKSGLCPSVVDVNTAAEFYAAWMAVYLAKDAWPDTEGVLVNSDCQTTCRSLRWGGTEPKRDSLRNIRAVLLHFLKLNNVRIRTKWVKGHQIPNTVRTYLNNKVDELAKQFRQKCGDPLQNER